MIKNNLRGRVRRPLTIRWSEEGLSGAVMFQSDLKDEKKTAMRRAEGRVSMSHTPGGTLPGQAGDGCSPAERL